MDEKGLIMAQDTANCLKQLVKILT